MDEPTSGLDARSAKLIMNGVRKIADSGRTIVCTIHQPSTEVFNLFDSLLLLRRGGRMVFFGELGENSENLIKYFEAFPGVNPIKPGYNPATWMLECIGAGVGGGHADAGAQPMDFAERFLVSDQKVLMEEDLDQEGVLHPSSNLPELKFETKRASNPRVQFQLLCLRFFRMYWRTPTYNLTRLFISVLLGCVFAVIYQGTDYSTYTGANSGVGLIFVSTIFLGLISFNSVMPVAADERTAFYRERASETYNALWYFVAGTLVEIPYIFFSSLLFCIIFYPSVGFTGYITFFYYWVVVSMNALLFVYFGQLMVFALPSVAVASTLGALFSGIFMLFAGFNPPTGSIPTGYMWVHWISPPTYTIAMLVSLVFADCSEGSTDGISCNSLQNTPPTIGDMTLKEYVEETFDMKHSDIWRNALILIILIVVFQTEHDLAVSVPRTSSFPERCEPAQSAYDLPSSHCCQGVDQQSFSNSHVMVGVQDKSIVASLKAEDDATDSRDVVSDKILAPKVSTYRLPRFNSRRLTPNSSFDDCDRLPRTESMFPQPRQLTNDDLVSADALMGDDVFTMNSTLSTVIENALGRPIPGLEVRFRDLELSAEVPQLKTGSLEVPTLWSHLQRGLRNLCLSKSKKLTVEKEILRGVTGVFRPGRITLVLGQPGSGKSSLMKVLANRFHMDKNIMMSGDIEYNGKERSLMLDMLPRDVAYVNQIDEHYPRMTVQETFEFAHRCCAGKELEPWVVDALKNSTPEREEHALKVMTAHHKFTPDLMVKKLGLDNCKNTIVGNAMLRGVSGGERKRVTTGEMLVSKKRLQLLDEISTGLDSAATYDICKSLKSAARNYNVTVVISLLQPSPEVFELFDDVLLLHGGSIMFHGKREDALPYFEQMGFHCPPRRDVADFLLDLGTDKQNAYVVGGPNSVPYNSAEFADRFRESSTFQKTLKRLDSPVKETLFLQDMNPFRLTFLEEVVVLLQRELMLKSRDTAYLVGRAVMVIVMGLLYGSTFWQMDESNSQLILGLLFSCSLFVSLSQSSQVPTFMEARSVFYKQRGANFFRSSSYVISVAISQIPMAALETVVFGAIVYWMGGYVAQVDRFIVFLVTLFLCQTWYTSYFFFLSSVSPNLTMAQPFMMVAVLFSMLFGGFLITKNDIPDYLIWIYWLDPLAWSIRALSVNEYLAPKFDVCVYNDIDYCTRYSETIGEYSLSVFNLPVESMWIWYGWIYLVAGFFVLIFASYLVLEYHRYESPETVAVVENEGVESQQAYSELPSTPRAQKYPESVIEIRNIDDIMGEVPTISVPIEPTGRGIAVPVTLAFHDLWQDHAHGRHCWPQDRRQNPREDSA
ncbi:unnamed protein product [Phytophthora fragariaefolia]|uniref:Unnamed protein product n=1 Tax=Phytophthora fragariaefolia TaxID=1490495 RepID=A0A9W6YI28_9STRA|nr:unnamed protein product [Phytophthora fragariaefolia]